jgi:hypothetical protein
MPGVRGGVSGVAHTVTPSLCVRLVHSHPVVDPGGCCHDLRVDQGDGVDRIILSGLSCVECAQVVAWIQAPDVSVAVVEQEILHLFLEELQLLLLLLLKVLEPPIRAVSRL